VAAYLAEDFASAREVMLDLPETGVCNVTFGTNSSSAGCCGTEPRKENDMTEDNVNEGAGAACCGGPAPKPSEACCVRDADAKAEGQSGCGCGTTLVEENAPAAVAAAACCG